MRSRLDDLIATADRQLASRSYDAAIDTYRTALSEPGAVEASVEELLELACLARDDARGIVRPLPPTVEMAAMPVEAVAVMPVEPQAEPEPAPAQPVVIPVVIDDRPMEPPRFSLVEDDPAILERFERERYPKLEVENLSILHPTPPPQREEIDPAVMKQIVIAAVIALVVVVVAIYTK